MPADGQQALVRAPIAAGGNVIAIVPQNFDDAFRIANALAQSGITPFKKPEECFAVIMAGAELGLTPFAATQSFAVINGRVSIWGDGMLGVVRANGVKVQETATGSIEAQDYVATCKATRPDGETVERSFSWADAKRANLTTKTGPWTQYPQRMMAMRARSWALRDACADILRGIRMAEEVQDYEPTEAHIVGEHDQHPMREVLGGQAGKDAFDDLAERMSASDDADALELVFDEAEKSNLSQNRMFALSEHYEACKEAHEAGKPTPPAPHFTAPPEPSPFPALNAEGEKVTSAEAFEAWKAKLTQDALAKCSDEERTTLRATFAAAQKRTKATPKKSAGAGGRANKDAGRTAAESSGADPGGEAPPASESAFETLKQECLDCLSAKAPRRALSDWTKKRDAATLTDSERADLDKIEANVRAGLTK